MLRTYLAKWQSTGFFFVGNAMKLDLSPTFL
jgi:hypothetical protein